MANKRYNIGLLVAAISDDFSKQLSIGAMEAAKALDTNLIIFPGKYLGIQQVNEDYETEYEYQYNVLFDIAAEAKLDYLIVAVGTIAYAHNHDYQKMFLDRLGDTPILSVAAEIEGYDSLMFDNRSGISEAVDYLASHGREHIGMIAGDLNNEEFYLRYEAYRQGLEKHGLPYKDSYMVTTNLAYRCYDEVEQLLDRNPELDAILCATDMIAYDVYEVLRRRNLRAGIDLAVVGFDDLPGDPKMDPPLASVKADAGQLGWRAVEKALNRLRGVKDDDRYIESQFIPRRSCFRYVNDEGLMEHLFRDDYATMTQRVRDYFARRYESATVDERSGEMVLELIDHLYQNYVAKPVDERVVEESFARLTEALPLKDDQGIDRILHGVYVWFLRNCPVDNIPYVQVLHRFFRRVREVETVEDVTKRYRERSHRNNEFIRDALMFGGSLKGNYARTLKKLNSVGSLTGFLYTLEKPITHYYGDAFPRELTWRFRAYSYGTEVFTLPRDQQLMATPKVFDNDQLCVNRQHVFVVADLFSADTQYGIALFEPQDEAFLDELELATYQLSSAVRTLDILGKQEKLLDELHATNLALDRMSKTDELTGAYNRKGFYPAANELIHAPQHQGKQFIICFADMDNLKLVNDCYGHVEGDFSLRLIIRCLAEVLGEGAVIGRMGGDEFAAVVPVSSGVTIDVLAERKERFIQRFNESGEKPYRVDMSMGMHQCACADDEALRAALAKADDLLYKEKTGKKVGR